MNESYVIQKEKYTQVATWRTQKNVTSDEERNETKKRKEMKIKRRKR